MTDVQEPTKWILIHDGSDVLFKGQCGQATSAQTIVTYDTEALMDADIITLALNDFPDPESL